MNEKLLEIKDLHIQYVTDEEVVYALNGINFSIRRGEAMALVGETGAGKTTTAMSILRLLPKYTGKVKQGEILLEGTDLLKATDKEMQDIRGRRISMIFQDPMTSLNPVIPIGKQIGEVIALHHKKMGKAEVENKVEEILNLVGIPAHRKVEYPHQFSGGMKQRVIIAIAIACNPELLIADEPTTALDVTIQAQVLKMINNLRKEFNTAVLLITHDLGIVANFCDSVAIMYAGEIIEQGTLEDIFDHSRGHHPYTVGLFGSIPSISDHKDRLSPIPGLMPDPTDLPKGCKFHTRCPHCMEKCKEGEVPTFVQGTHQIKCHLMQGQATDGGV
ncbi:MAG TPA: ABC transporter ATP-binding protein [Candidatus Agathobaculum stercoravium]|nr:ABC transporter ATP-binding protein [Candidatus Agathobaculum stercoravium]